MPTMQRILVMSHSSAACPIGRPSSCAYSRQQLRKVAASPAPCPSARPRSRVIVPPVEMGRRSAKIALRKGKSDAKKAKIYGRIGKKIIQLAKAGGADPTTNAALDTLLRQAKDLGVPKDVVERNLKRATDSKQGDYQEVTYEAYGPGGTGLVIFCLTDNLNRTASEVKPTVTKAGAKVAEPGSVLFNFNRCGMIVVDRTTEDAVFEAAMEAGAEDVEPVSPEEDGQPSTSYKVFVPVEAFAAAKGTLRQLGFSVNEEDSDLVFKAAAPVEVDDEAFSRCEALVEKLLELDDVDNVFTNCDGLIA
ncbi:hypothetical protein PLESTB_001960000 [Pleodorina starrii]|uniref:Transcriptional regulatory protein n=1 Tax=Pleodorina starrii TaxID=330485 RepID=A0A9W6FAY3_9CHLO|nr:hypothetical protein PLESTM_002069100 [Pleodorina starrii]GLC62922.1 hypothetical protein PLESTB_001960000 [Pleodorina starrii]GLC70343.1 hypothetical protein PLESTF_000962300 [Pleodorina starrii]